jgi:hypothetical protein
MKLSSEEGNFLLHWIYDEAHYQEGNGPAKTLQLRHHAIPAELALLIAAAMPDANEQEAAGFGPPPARLPVWPWPENRLPSRVREAERILSLRPTAKPAESYPPSSGQSHF